MPLGDTRSDVPQKVVQCESKRDLPSTMKIILFVLSFCLNAVVAAVAPEIIHYPLVHNLMRLYERTPTAFVRADIITAITAFGLGYFVYRRWHPRAAKWVWVAGLCLFAGRALVWKLRDPAGVDHSILWQMVGEGPSESVQGFGDWAGYTIPCIRMIFYSNGAFCARIQGMKRR